MLGNYKTVTAGRKTTSSDPRPSNQERKPYLKALVASAPFSIGQALIEIPKGTADEVVERALKGELSKEHVGRGVLSAFTGTGLGRSVGRLTVGTLTAPFFISGIRDLKSDDNRRKAIGLGKVVGSGAVAALGKGAIEGLARGGWKWSPEVAREIGSLVTSRGLLGLAAGAATAYGAARSMQDEEKGGPHGFLRRSVWPAVIGISGGAAKGFVDELARLRALGPVKPTFASPRVFLKTYGPRMAGRATAGLIGALGISELARLVIKKDDTNKKTSATEELRRKLIRR